MDRLPGTAAPASLVASPSYARAVLPAARALLTTQFNSEDLRDGLNINMAEMK